MAVVKNLMVRSGADFSALSKETKKAQKTLNSFKRSISTTMKAIGATLAILGTGRLIRNSNAAYDYQIEQETKLAVVMRRRMSATDEMIASIKQLTVAQQKLGIIGDEVQLAGAQQLATFLKSNESLKTLIPAMNNLAAQQKGYNATGQDLVNISNMMGRVMEGQVGALRRVGISFTDAEEKVLRYGNEQERASMLAKIIENNVGNMNEALANTPRGRWKQIQNDFGDMGEELGRAFITLRDAFIPAMEYLAKIGLNVANTLRRSFTYIAGFMNGLFGKRQAKQIDNVSGSTRGAVGTIDDLGDAYQEAGKKAKRSVAGFDEINTLNEGKSSGEDDLGIDTDTLFSMADGIGDISESLDEISTKAQEMGEKVREAFSKLSSFIKENETIIKASIAGIIAAFVAFKVVANWSGIITVLNVALGVLAKSLTALLSPFLLVAAAIAAVVAILVHLWKTNEGFRDSVLKVWATISSFMIAVSKDMWTIVKSVWDSYGQNIVNGLLIFVGAIQRIILALWHGFLEPVITAALQMLSWLWESHLRAMIMQLGELVAKIISAALEIWTKFILPLTVWLAEILAPIFAEVFTLMVNIFGSTVAFIAGYAKGLFKILGGIIDFIVGVFTADWAKAWQGLVDIVGGIFDILVAVVKYPLNIIIDAVNTLIRGLNKISFEIPSWVPGLGGKSYGISIPHIPKLAQGGITGVNNPFMAIVGDNKTQREVVSPLDDLMDMISTAVGTAMLSANQFNNNTQGDIVVQIDGTTLARVTNPFNSKENARLGNAMIVAT